MSKHAPVQKLLVEGQNDRHVIWALCQYSAVPQTFAVEEPNGPAKGIQPLLASFPCG
ncbi:MAG: hypothetical protein KBG20_17680 [Caldilineaceae bacterium]|nr:hypothetical protein [Caldilineaceae bacterium]MBP8108974.1 hypothetical protein [Caldilineaceae bacterium]MBP8125206.1 hypothetical protein [Caldilineaceae bacterium]MBP9074141.1 hypothetical protein [Caldilineaceae bacterium]